MFTLQAVLSLVKVEGYINTKVTCKKSCGNDTKTLRFLVLKGIARTLLHPHINSIIDTISFKV
ncbi:CLUMA_CG019921, isoform A [Clunio marinus]|uniref:CLUMA_CG019921, isoform A n=1 Tax=Clunio marinus TaxID=568069 RepID=A0A1J1J4G5_9DIPT|nr:CLUMA_CG019921, isoform A [Clunio marinus]